MEHAACTEIWTSTELFVGQTRVGRFYIVNNEKFITVPGLD